MVICFTEPIRHGGDRLHLLQLPPQRRFTHPMGLKQGTYNIWDDHGFRLTQAIQDVKQGNYELIFLTETKILDMMYCRNCLGFDVISY